MSLFICQNLDKYISASGPLFETMLDWHTIPIEQTMMNTLYVYIYLWTSVRGFISNVMFHFYVYKLWQLLIVNFWNFDVVRLKTS